MPGYVTLVGILISSRQETYINRIVTFAGKRKIKLLQHDMSGLS